MLHLADQLTAIAGAWREAKTDALVDKYHRTLYAMVLAVYDVHMLPVQDQLPAELIPELLPPFIRVAIRQAYEQHELSAK